MARRRRKVGIYRGREGGEGVRECGRGAVRDGGVGWGTGRRGRGMVVKRHTPSPPSPYISLTSLLPLSLIAFYCGLSQIICGG